MTCCASNLAWPCPRGGGWLDPARWRRSRQGLPRPLYIFDLDGTLALIDHRRHILEEKEDSHRWRRFYAACDKDISNDSVIITMELLKRSGAEIWIFSGRSDEVRDKTVKWLTDNTSFEKHDLATALTMRRKGDYTGDHDLKRKWLESMLIDDRNRLVAIYDDRDRVVQMWRSAGVTCFQVAPGEF